MRWRLVIHLVFVLVSIATLIFGCNCDDTIKTDENVDDTVRINNGFATKDDNGNLILKRCDKNFADCNDDVEDGCEVDLKNDINNCGKCENVCQTPANVSSVECENSICVIDYCIGGFIDLDRKYENGCEYKCNRSSEKDIASNMQDDDCDGFIDNVCRYTVDNNIYNIASNLTGRISGLFSTSNVQYTFVGFIETSVDNSSKLNVVAIDSERNVLFNSNVGSVSSECSIGSVSMNIRDSGADIFWSKNCDESSNILYNKLSFSGNLSEPKVIYNSFNPVTNIIISEYKSVIYMTFETIENNKKVILFTLIDIDNYEIISKKVVSTEGFDCYGHNMYIVDDFVYVSYWEMKDGYSELVVMANDITKDVKTRYPIQKTEKNAGGTALSYGSGYFILMWTESESDFGSMYLSVLDNNLQNLLLKKVDFNYDEFGLPVINYNSNIFGSTFMAIRNGEGYVMFSDIDLSGKKISEIIISPVFIIEKPYMSLRGDEFYIFYTDINSKMKYFLNMKRVYCEKY